MKKERIIEILIIILLLGGILGGFLTYRYKTVIKPNTYDIVFKDIDSIVKGSPVRFMGINVGHVVKLKRRDKYIVCRIRVTKEGVKIPDETRAKVAFNGLGGSKSIELLPPITDDPEIKGIVSDESLRINDFVGVVNDLYEVCKLIDKFVQSIEPMIIMEYVKEATNPEIIERVDNDIQKIVDREDGIKRSMKQAVEVEKKLSKFTEWINSFLSK